MAIWYIFRPPEFIIRPPEFIIRQPDYIIRPLEHTHTYHHIGLFIRPPIFPIMYPNLKTTSRPNSIILIRFVWQVTDAAPCGDHHIAHSLDLTTTLRSELAASTYKRDRLLHELTEVKSSLCARDTECETLRTQSARQSALITSLQSRLHAVEHRERNLQARSESTTLTLQRERKCLDEKNKELAGRVRRMECDLSSEEQHREQTR